MQIYITINCWQDSIKEIKEYLKYDDDLPSDFIERLELKPKSDKPYSRCYTEKFKTLGEAVEFCLKIFPKLIIEYDQAYEITFYTSYVE